MNISSEDVHPSHWSDTGLNQTSSSTHALTSGIKWYSMYYYLKVCWIIILITSYGYLYLSCFPTSSLFD